MLMFLQGVHSDLDGLGFGQLVPVTALTALGLSLVQPHPVDASGIWLTNAANNTVVGHRRHQVGCILCACNPIVHLHLVGILQPTGKEKTRTNQ